MTNQLLSETRRRFYLFLLLIAATGLLAGCGAARSGQKSTALEGESVRSGRLAELERKVDMQTSQLDQVISTLQEGGIAFGAGSGIGRLPASGDYDTLLSREIFFDLNEFALDDYEKEILDIVAKRMAEFPSSFLEITGYADPSGNKFYNYLLSQQRADAARRYLIERYDIPLNRIDVQGFGPEHQKYPNDVGGDVNKNRRIEILLKYPVDVAFPLP